MQNRFTFFLAFIILSLVITSCSVMGTNVISESITSQTQNESLSVSENDVLRTENSDLMNQNSELQKELEKAIADKNDLNNYYPQYVYDLLQKIDLNKRKVVLFYGYLKIVQIENRELYGLNDDCFVFSIDQVTLNPAWDGPGSGFFLNSIEEYQEFIGGHSTLFVNFANGVNAVSLTEIKNYYEGTPCYFYSVGDEIVLVGPAGP